jgi:hypothetical protein
MFLVEEFHISVPHLKLVIQNKVSICYNEYILYEDTTIPKKIKKNKKIKDCYYLITPPIPHLFAEITSQSKENKHKKKGIINENHYRLKW